MIHILLAHLPNIFKHYKCSDNTGILVLWYSDISASLLKTIVVSGTLAQNEALDIVNIKFNKHIWREGRG